MKTAVVLTFDRLALRCFGCYGCLSHPTPHFDDFAAASVLFDQHFAENVDPAAGSHAWWTGRYHFLQSNEQQQNVPAVLFRLLQDSDVETHLLLESAGSPTVPLPAESPPSQRVSGYSDLMDAAVDRLLQWRRADNRCDRLLWLKSAGVRFDDNSVAPTDHSEESSATNRDEPAPPEQLTRYTTALQTTDALFGRLWDSVKSYREATGDEVLMIVSAAQGQPLGEQARLPDAFQLPAEFQRLGEAVIHTPLMMHVSGWGAAADTFQPNTRRRSLVQTVDLLPTLLDWFKVFPMQPQIDGTTLCPLLGDVPEFSHREFICFGDDNRAYGLRTADACLMASPEAIRRTASGRREPADDTSEPDALPAEAGVCLFEKPDDLWDVNNIAGQEPEGTLRLLAALREFLGNR